LVVGLRRGWGFVKGLIWPDGLFLGVARALISAVRRTPSRRFHLPRWRGAATFCARLPMMYSHVLSAQEAQHLCVFVRPPSIPGNAGVARKALFRPSSPRITKARPRIESKPARKLADSFQGSPAVTYRPSLWTHPEPSVSSARAYLAGDLGSGRYHPAGRPRGRFRSGARSCVAFSKGGPVDTGTLR
jgi:hypothetical protein